MFVCGGAFDGLEPIIKRSIGKKLIGFGSEATPLTETGRIPEMVLPEDLLRFGLIPEFVGRLPVISTLEPLDQDALVRIFTEPKNALVKQYQKLLEMDQVNLVFEEDALKAIADEAIRRNTGARGLRAIIESIMLDVMFDLPSRDDVTECVVTEDTVRNKRWPPV